MSAAELGRSIYNNALPGLVREYLGVVQSAEDPEVLRRAIELGYKLNDKNGPQAGVVVNVVFDMANGLTATSTPVPSAVEIVEQVQLAAPAEDDPESIDLSEFLSAPAEPFGATA
jgi:hypothetical protein